MKRSIISFILLCVVCAFYSKASAQNTLVYFRYDIIPNDIGKIIFLIDSIKENSSDRFVLYFDNQGYEDNRYEELVSNKDFLKSTCIYEPENEEEEFSKFSSNLLSESVMGTCITGVNDNEWRYIFVLSDLSQKQEIIRLITANSLQKRIKRLHFIIYDDMSSIHKGTFRQIVDDNKITVFEFN